MKDFYVGKIASVVEQVAALDPTHPMEVFLIGTASLRKADDGQHLVNALEGGIQKLGIKNTYFKIISQEDEGISMHLKVGLLL